ncbi:MAG: hypothetical protein LC799_16440, partial [Actinobacteria bacterium]|nr:hypothetical protein [Actinomycetota bacterium]
ETWIISAASASRQHPQALGTGTLTVSPGVQLTIVLPTPPCSWQAPPSRHHQLVPELPHDPDRIRVEAVIDGGHVLRASMATESLDSRPHHRLHERTAKLRDIEHQRQRLTERLTETKDDLSESTRLIELSLTLLEDPQELYRRCDDEQRRLLNQAIFQGLYIEDDRITGHELHEPFAHLHTIQANRRLDHGDKPDPGVITSCAQDTARPPPDREVALLCLTVSKRY